MPRKSFFLWGNYFCGTIRDEKDGRKGGSLALPYVHLARDTCYLFSAAKETFSPSPCKMGRVGIRITSAALTRQYISFAPYTSSSAKKSSETKTRSVFSPFPPFSRFFRNPHFASQIRGARRERKLCLSLLSIVYRLPMPSIPSCCVVVVSASQLFSSPPSEIGRAHV